MEIILVYWEATCFPSCLTAVQVSPKEEDERLAFGVRGQAIQSMMLGGNLTATKTSYSDCRTKKKRASRPLEPALKLSVVVIAHLNSNLQTLKGIA